MPLWAWVLIIGLLLTLYILSYGPLSAVYAHSNSDSYYLTYDLFYLPLMEVYYNTELVDFLDDHESWWIEKLYPPPPPTCEAQLFEAMREKMTQLSRQLQQGEAELEIFLSFHFQCPDGGSLQGLDPLQAYSCSCGRQARAEWDNFLSADRKEILPETARGYLPLTYISEEEQAQLTEDFFGVEALPDP